jgi:hypothetical protein
VSASLDPSLMSVIVGFADGQICQWPGFSSADCYDFHLIYYDHEVVGLLPRPNGAIESSIRFLSRFAEHEGSIRDIRLWVHLPHTYPPEVFLRPTDTTLFDNTAVPTLGACVRIECG